MTGETMMIWDDSMSTGIPRIDDQHKTLFQKFNELSEAISSNRSREVAGSVLDFLQFYAKWLFGQEEDCMNKYRCPVADQNQKAHAEFLKKIDRFYTEWQTGNMTSKLAQKTYNELEQTLQAELNIIPRADLRDLAKSLRQR